MKLTTSEGLTLRRALMELRDGNARRFDDLLWLGFGDRCQEIVNSLVRGACIDLPDSSCWYTATITPRGENLVRSITAQLESTAAVASSR